MEEQTIKQNFARNLHAYRKSRNLTQSQLAEKLNYSDKSVSKWECGDVLPDIVTISMIAEFFGITIDQLIGSKIPHKEVAKDRHLLVTLMSCGLSFLLAGIAFVILLAYDIPNAWMLFIYALPASCIVAIVFCAMWFALKWTACSVSILVWTAGLCAYLSIYVFTGKANLWFIFIVCLIFQVLVILWFIWQDKHIKSKKERELAEKRDEIPDIPNEKN